MSGVTRCRRRYHWNLLLGSWLAIGGAIATSVHCAFAQIVPDGTLPNNSRVTTQNNTSIIEGGTKSGSNLFHSFEQFSLPTGSSAYFNNALDIQNIFGRVTGKSVSNIDGLIKANGTANLFLINPNGMIFGKNASLNVGGSFVATTANAIGFGNQGFFSADNPNTPELLTVNPSALLFNQIAAASIQNNSVAPAGVSPSGTPVLGLRVPDGRSLLLIGGDISMDGGRLNALSGRVELGGLAGVGTVGLASNGNSFSLSFAPDSLRSNVFVANDAQVSVRGAGGGDIAVNANTFTATNGGRLVAGTEAQGNGGDITVNANQVRLSGIGSSNNGAGLYNQAISGAVGNTGNIFVNAKSVEVASGATIESSVLSGAVGNGGKVNINAESLSLTDGAKLLASTFGQGDAGSVNINARDRVSFDGVGSNGLPSAALSNVEEKAKGNAGNINITAGSLLVKNGAQLESRTRGRGNAGNVNINARDTVSFDDSGSGAFSSVEATFDGSGSGAFSTVEATAMGKGGNININARSVSLTNGTQVSAYSIGTGSAGNITFNTGELIVRGRADISTDSYGFKARNAGDIMINTGRLILQDGAQVSATNILNQGNGGSLTVNASESVELTGISANRELPLPSGLLTGTLGTGNAGELTINTGRLTVQNGAVVATFSSDGKGGNLTVNAQSLKLSGTSSDARTPSGLSTDTLGAKNAGDLTINTKQLIVENGAAASVSTFGQGQGGSLRVNASESVQLSGTSSNGLSSGLYAQSFAAGNAGDLTINTGELIVRDSAKVTVAAGNAANAMVPEPPILQTLGVRIPTSSAQIGNAGNLEITSRSIQMDRGSLRATTESGEGGNITLLKQDLILMRRGSQISTTAGLAAAGGNGGNITINAPNGFIVAAPRENSDITANAFSGSGGNVKIDVTSIYGIAARSRADLVRLLGTNEPTQLDPRLLTTNDITAISQTSPTFGEVTINTPSIDFTRAFVNLPNVPLDTKIAQGCTTGSSQAQSEFIITGRGGLPPNPGEALSTDAVQVDLVTVNPEVDKRSTTAVSTSSTSPTPSPIVEATGWVIDANGDVILTANPPTVTPYTSWQKTVACQKAGG